MGQEDGDRPSTNTHAEVWYPRSEEREQMTPYDDVWSEMTVDTLRRLFRYLESWRAVYESDQVDVLEWEGREYCLWDLEHLYEQIDLLPTRQRQAIEWFLVRDRSEREVAVMMGLSPTNPVGAYAASGLEKLLGWVRDAKAEVSYPRRPNTYAEVRD